MCSPVEVTSSILSRTNLEWNVENDETFFRQQDHKRIPDILQELDGAHFAPKSKHFNLEKPKPIAGRIHPNPIPKRTKI